MEDLSLVYGFGIPKKVWEQINAQQQIVLAIKSYCDSNTERLTLLSEFKIGGYTNDEESKVVIGFETRKYNNSLILLEINDINSFFNEHAQELQEIYTELFKIVVTPWAEIVKVAMDRFAEEHKDTTEKVELPEIDLPSDLKVEWWIVR